MMRIRLAILERNESYLQRLVSVFNTRYSDKLEVYSFTDPEVAMQTLADAKIEMLVAGDTFEIDASRLPRRCGFAYFVDSADIDSLNNQRTICRFQKADQIYRQILSVYSENAGSITGLKLADGDCHLIAFASPCGGAGSSTLAAACAAHFAQQGKKALYLNLEVYGKSDDFFTGAGSFDMSDVIYALKSKKANLAMKLESCVRQDPGGVYFYSAPKVALDMLDMRREETELLLNELQLSGGYDYIILDMDFLLDEAHIALWRKTHALVITGDGSQIANSKLERAYQAIVMKEQSVESPLNNRIVLAYNQFSSKTGRQLQKAELRSIGGAPRYENASVRQVLGQLYRMDMFDRIIG